MKQHIKHIFTTVIALLVTFVAWGTEITKDFIIASVSSNANSDGQVTFVYTTGGESIGFGHKLPHFTQNHTFKLINYDIVDENIHYYLSMNISTNSYIQAKSGSVHQPAIGMSQSTAPYTVTFSSDEYFIAKVEVYNPNNILRKQMYGNEKSLSFTTTDYEMGNGHSIFYGIHRFVVTLSDTKPMLDMSQVNVALGQDSYDYTGSAINPTIISVTFDTGSNNFGVLNLTASDYDLNIVNNTNAGVATMTLTAKGGNYTGTCTRDFTINKVDATVTGLTLTNTDYNGEVKPLCSGATVTGGTLMYSVDQQTWSEDVPSTANVGSYPLYYRVDADQNHNSIPVTSAGTATINAANVSYGCLSLNAVAANNVQLTIGESEGTTAKDISIPCDIDVNSITMNRTFTIGKAATVMLPFTIPLAKVSGGTFYNFIGVDKNDTTGWEVVMQEVNQVCGTLQAHTPYLFMPTAEKMIFDLGGETVIVKANSEQTYSVQP